ncbi:MAG: outer membrane lipoprotein-sorting protein [Myxococcota bacterium]
MRSRCRLGALVLGLALSGGAAAEEDARPLTRDEVQERWHSRLDGRHFVARIRMRVDLGGLLEDRWLTVHRTDHDTAAERVLIRFDAPPALRNLGLLYFEQSDRPNDYFLYRPAVRRVRRLHEATVRDNLYGIDPEFLGFGIARSEPTRVEAMEVVRIGERASYRILERARLDNRRFEERIVWLDRATFIPLRTVHRLDGRTVLRAETLEIDEVQGIPTPRRMRFERPVDGTRVDLAVEAVDYAAEIPEEVFSIFELTRGRSHAP